jgi:hypothetical protein
MRKPGNESGDGLPAVISGAMTVFQAGVSQPAALNLSGAGRVKIASEYFKSFR